MEPQWLEWAKQLQAIAQAGLTYSKDVYDIERFEMIRNLSIDIMANHTDASETTIKNLFANETGYATPKVDVRAVVFKENRILLVKEKADNGWTLPGGWADVGLTPSEAAVKETKEESGFDVQPLKVLAVYDRNSHPHHPPSAFHIYKVFIQCEIIGGSPQEGVETSGVDFFEEQNLPVLSTDRIRESQIKAMFHHLRNPEEPAYFD